MKMSVFVLSTVAATILLGGCGTTDPRSDVVYPYNPPTPKAEYREQRTTAPATRRSASGSCPGDAEELAPGSICPQSARCFKVSGGKRCIDYER